MGQAGAATRFALHTAPRRCRDAPRRQQHAGLRRADRRRIEPQPRDSFGRQGVGRVDRTVVRVFRLVAEEPEQGQAANPEECVVYIGHIAWTVGDAAILSVLALHDEVDQLVLVDPFYLAEHAHGREIPP